MFLPIGDTPNPKNYIPWVTWALMAVNVAVYVLVTLPLTGNMGAYEEFLFQHGYKPGAPEFEDLIASMFLHGGLFHLGGNMLFLWIFGDNVEHRLGRIRYLVVYLATGALATWTFSAFSGDSMIPLVGASGAISGALGAYYVFFPRNRVKTFVAFFPFFFDVLYIPVRWVLGFYVLVDNLLPFVLGAQTGVAYGAHLGGFLGGVGVALAVEKRLWGSRQTVTGPPGARRRVDPFDASADVLRSIREHDRKGALRAMAGLTPAQTVRLGAAACVSLAVWLEEDGKAAAGFSLLRKCIASRPGESDLSVLYLALGQMRLRQGQPAAAYQHFLSAMDANPSLAVKHGVSAGMATIEKLAGRPRQ